MHQNASPFRPPPRHEEESTAIMKTNMADYLRKIEDNLRELLASCQGSYISDNYLPSTQLYGLTFVPERACELGKIVKMRMSLRYAQSFW